MIYKIIYDIINTSDEKESIGVSNDGFKIIKKINKFSSDNIYSSKEVINYRYYVGAGGSIPGVGTGVSSGIIPSMQGFFIKALANSMLSVTNSARVHSSQAFYKEGAANDLPILRLKTIDINGLTDEAIIRFYEESTFEHDRDYDAFKLFGWMYPPEDTEVRPSPIPSGNPDSKHLRDRDYPGVWLARR